MFNFLSLVQKKLGVSRKENGVKIITLVSRLKLMFIFIYSFFLSFDCSHGGIIIIIITALVSECNPKLWSTGNRNESHRTMDMYSIKTKGVILWRNELTRFCVRTWTWWQRKRLTRPVFCDAVLKRVPVLALARVTARRSEHPGTGKHCNLA